MPGAAPGFEAKKWEDEPSTKTPVNAEALKSLEQKIADFAFELFTSLDSLRSKGGIDCSGNPVYPKAEAGDVYEVSNAGKIGGSAGLTVHKGDLLICAVEAGEGPQSEVGSSWVIIPGLEALTALAAAAEGIAEAAALAAAEGLVKAEREARETLGTLIAAIEAELGVKPQGTYTTVKERLEKMLEAANALLYQGTKNCSANPNYPAAKVGNVYVVSNAGKIGGVLGTTVEVGDLLICRVAGAEGTQLEVGANWDVIQVAGLAAAVTAERERAEGVEATKADLVGGVLKASEVPSSVVNSSTAVVNVKDFGATGNGATDDAAAIRSALAALSVLAESEPNESASGNVLYFPAGTYKIGSSIKFENPHQRVTVRGAGKKATMLRRSANVPIFVIEGEADETAKMYLDATFEGLSLNSSTRTAWTEPLVRLRYAQFVHWRNVNFFRAGGSALTAVRYYDSEIQNCRFDYCGTTGLPATHLMCSEQGKVKGEAGYSEDVTNNITFLDCNWESNPGIDLHLDGRQANGTYSGALRLNSVKLRGCRMESDQSTERTGEPRVLFENTSHCYVDSLAINAKGVKSGESPSDWLVLKKTFDTAIGRVVCNSIEYAENGMRTGVKLEETIGTKIGLVCGSVQTINKPANALIEFVGENTNLSIDAAYYDNNPGNAPLYAGTTPTSWFGDPNLTTVVPAWSSKSAIQGTRALVTKTGYWVRYVPTRPIKVSAVKFAVTTKASKNDKVQVAVYSASTGSKKVKRLAKSTETAGKLNEENKVQEVALESAVWLSPGSVYYFYLGCEQVESGTQATLVGVANEGGTSLAMFVPGSVAPNADWLVKTESYPAPEEAEPETSSSSAPMPWAVTA